MLLPESIRWGGAPLCLGWVTPAGASRFGAALGALDRHGLLWEAGHLPPLTLEDAEGSQCVALPASSPVQDSGNTGSGVRGLPAFVRASGLRKAAQRAEARQAWVGNAAPARELGRFRPGGPCGRAQGRGRKLPLSAGRWCF